MTTRTIATVTTGITPAASPAYGADVKVMISGGFSAAYRDLIPEYERTSRNRVATSRGASMGDTPDAIPGRLHRGEPADVVIMVGDALDELIRRGKVVAGTRVDLARSGIGMAVRAGAPKPDISSVDAFKRVVLDARSIAYSDSASGVYLSTELFPRLGIADRISAKSKQIKGEPVGAVVARGDAEIGFQQISELLPIAGIDYVGPLPPEIQKVTVFSAGIAAGSRDANLARGLITFLTSAAAVAAIAKSGLEPVIPPQHK